MKHNGWRKPTPGLAQAEVFAQAGERLSVSKSKAIAATKKVAAAIGLNASDMLLLDTLSAVAQPQDWEAGRRPIVWPSNAFLEDHTGMSLRAVQRHTRRLCEAGVISMKDSPNGKRWGKRDDDGFIVEAYGFDLAPLAARAEEFEALHAELQEERALCKSLRNMITVSRRIIRAKIEKALEAGLKGPWRELRREYEVMIDRLPTKGDTSQSLLEVVDWFKALKETVEETFIAAFDWPENSDANQHSQKAGTTTEGVYFSQKMTPRDDVDGMHIQTTNQLKSVNSKSFEKKPDANFVRNKQSVDWSESSKHKLDAIDWSIGRANQNVSEVDLNTVMAACPEFASIARSLVGYVKSWEDLHKAAGMVRPMVGISEDAWNIAQQKLGPLVAAAAMSLIYEKASTGEVASAGGYLRGMVSKALDGELHLERSFYGRLSAGGGMN